MLSEQMHAARARRLAAESDYIAAKIKMADAPGANAHLLAVPSEPGLRIANDPFRRIVRDLLGLSEIRVPMYCCCTGRKHKNKHNPKEGQRTALLPNDMASMAHLATCKHMGGQIATHDAALRLTASIVKALPNAFARTEQIRIIDKGRMDLIVHHIDGSKPTHYDFTVANQPPGGIVPPHGHDQDPRRRRPARLR
jgi:hypothetical protein